MARRLIVGCASLAAILSFHACGGGGSYSTPTNPSPPPAASALTIDIRSSSGAQSFNPNPAAVTQGRMVSWRNSDSTTHRIVANDGSFDTGNISPGSASNPLAVPRGMNYHCSLHTNMVGAIGIEAEPPPPCTGPYC